MRPTLATVWICATLIACSGNPPRRSGNPDAPQTAESPNAVLQAAPPSDWRIPEPADTLHLKLEAGWVVIELAPEFAPAHVANLRKLIDAGYFDGIGIVRVHDNFVTQWGDPEGTRDQGTAARSLEGEFDAPISFSEPFTALAGPDGFAPEVGFSRGFAIARDRKSQRAWLAHCYGSIGVGRDVAAASGNGAELYAVIGHAPRQLDRNTTVVGRVIHGIEHLAALPRGSGPLGFYEDVAQRSPILQMRSGDQLPAESRLHVEVLREDSDTFARYVEARRNRRDEWYLRPAGHVDLCNVNLPTRLRPAAE